VRVFISHSSKDKPAVLALAAALQSRGFEPWVDKWEIAPGDDIVAKINQGLAEADAGLIVFSASATDSRWVQAEWSALTFARIEHGQVLIPLTFGDDVDVPPLLAPLLRRRIDEVDAIADALRGRGARPASAPSPERGTAERVLITLQTAAGGAVQADVRCGERLLGSTLHPQLPAGLAGARAAFLRGFGSGAMRDRAAAERSASEAQMAELGRALCALCLPAGSGEALQAMIDACTLGTRIEVCFAALDESLLGLPFEALRMPDGRLLATQPAVVMWRRPLGIAATARAPLAGPLKLLVAVGAPDEGHSASAVLDQERELQNILDAVEPLNRQDNAQVRILEVGHPDQIAQAFADDAYHVLHLSCHGRPGALELEDEDGRAVQVAPAELLAPLQRITRPLPLVLLNACHGGVPEGQADGPAASFATALLRAGVPAVLAMQTAVSDGYATALARAFYAHLTRGEHLRPSRALALARQELEAVRQLALRSAAAGAATPPEYASATLFVAGEEAPLADFGADRQPLRVRPVYTVAGPVPQLRTDDLIGRRRELREALRTLRDPAAACAGVVITGMGGVGKSALAGRVMQRLAEDGWMMAVQAGRFSLGEAFTTVGAALRDADRASAQQLGERFMQPNLDDPERIRLVHKALNEQPVLLVLDDFEQNLSQGGSDFLDPDVDAALAELAIHARHGRLLVTCRYPVPGADGWLQRVTLGALSAAEVRKLVLRLPALHGLQSDELSRVLRLIGGHPRMLEFLDALLRGGRGRLPHVSRKLKDLLKDVPVDPARTKGQLDDSLHAAQLLIARNVFLEELLTLAQAAGAEGALLQLAASNLPVTPDGLARMLADDPAQPGDVAAAQRAIVALEDLSLLHRQPDGAAAVHRWTAQGLAGADAAAHRARCVRAGRYRWWQVTNETHDLGDATEALRNHLAGEDFDEAVSIAQACFDALRGFQQAVGVAALASEMLERLPESHGSFAFVADEEAKAHLALGATSRAFARYAAMLQAHQRLAQAEPDRADYQRDLSVSLDKMGELYRDLGHGELAREAFSNSLAIAQRLAQAEPDRADYQRDLSVSFIKMGDLYRDLGQGELAREAFSNSLAIRRRLAQAEPDRADYQRDLSVSFIKMGDLHRDLGQGELAREAFSDSLAIFQRLAQAEPDRADYQRDLSVSFERMGDLYRALGQGELAREAFSNSLAIRQRLAQAEPDRADYQRNLSVSFIKMGDLYRDLGQGELAREAFSDSLAIAQRLAQAEPDRADYQRDLSVSLDKMGNLYRDLGQGELAREAFSNSLAIAQRLAQAEPDRADYQRDLSVSFDRMGDLYRDLGQGELAREALSNSLAIRQRLAQAEPDRADYQRDLSVSFTEMGALCLEAGDTAAAREMYAGDLAIAERLAQAEPGRADYQRDLVISLLQMGTLPVGDANAHLSRAWTTAAALAESGRMSPADKPLIDQLRRLMDERGLPTA